MHLLPCNHPQGSLESAPCTSLRAPRARLDSPQDRWEGFWRVADERYYTRCIRADGTAQWYRIADIRATKILRFRPSLVSVRRTYVMTNDARRTLTRDVRRTVLLGRYGQRSIFVRTTRVSRRTRGAR